MVEGQGWGSDGLGGAVVDQTFSVFKANWGIIDGYTLVLCRFLLSLQKTVHQDA